MYVIRHDSSIEDDLRVSGYSYLCQKNSSIKHEWHSSTQPCLEPVMAKTLRQSQHDWRSAVSIIYVIDTSTNNAPVLEKFSRKKQKWNIFEAPAPHGSWRLAAHFPFPPSSSKSQHHGDTIDPPTADPLLPASTRPPLTRPAAETPTNPPSPFSTPPQHC